VGFEVIRVEVIPPTGALRVFKRSKYKLLDKIDPNHCEKSIGS